jgi:hypothetical protein
MYWTSQMSQFGWDATNFISGFHGLQRIYGGSYDFLKHLDYIKIESKFLYTCCSQF